MSSVLFWKGEATCLKKENTNKRKKISISNEGVEMSKD